MVLNWNSLPFRGTHFICTEGLWLDLESLFTAGVCRILFFYKRKEREKSSKSMFHKEGMRLGRLRGESWSLLTAMLPPYSILFHKGVKPGKGYLFKDSDLCDRPQVLSANQLPKLGVKWQKPSVCILGLCALNLASSAVSQGGAPWASLTLDCSPLLVHIFLGIKYMPGPEFLEAQKSQQWVTARNVWDW